MGVIIRLVLFLVGALGFVFTGLDTAQEHFGAPVADWLGMMGETPAGIANSMLSVVSGGIDSLGGVLAGVGGAEGYPEAPSMLVNYGPEAITAIVSMLLVMFATRR